MLTKEDYKKILTEISDEEIKKKLTSLINYNLPVSIKREDINTGYEVIKKLQELSNEYSRSAGLDDLEIYDRIKKEMIPYLSTLARVKDMLSLEYSYLNDYLKDEKRAEIIKRLVKEEGVSFTQAKEYAKTVDEYVEMRKNLHRLLQISQHFKTMYDFYMKVWQMVFQSVSTATKELFNSKTQ